LLSSATPADLAQHRDPETLAEESLGVLDVHTRATADQSPVVGPHQELEPVDLVAVVVISRLIQSQPKRGPASAVTSQEEPDLSARVVLQELA
jgi:hypothetical protein